MTATPLKRLLPLAALAIVNAIALPARAAEPAFAETFTTACVADNAAWKVSSLLRKASGWASRFSCAAGETGRTGRQLTVELRPGDSYDRPDGSNPTERAEIEIQRPDLVRFDAPVWYRFAFRLDGDWQAGANRTVIHQIKQNIASSFDTAITAGAPCLSANPFFRVHVREFDGRLALRADVAESSGCPSDAGRHLVCKAVPISTDQWQTVHVAMLPSTEPNRGSVRVWINGAECGTYRGRMGYPTYGVQKDGKPFIDTPPRFGLYRDALAFSQRASFDGIAFWTEHPGSNPEWRGIGPLSID